MHDANKSKSSLTQTWITVSALLLGVGLTAGVLLLGSKGTPIEIGAAFWEALTSFGTLAAAAAAAYTARKAIAIDERVAERARDRERRDAIPLAYALHFELTYVAVLMAAATRELSGPLIDVAGTLRGVRQTAGQFNAPILRDAVTALGCFDPETGKALGVALAATQHYATLSSVPEMEVPNPDFDNAALRALLENARKYQPVLYGAIERLNLYVD